MKPDTRAILEDRRLRQGWTTFLRQFTWDHVGTFTFPFTKCSADLATRRFEHWANGLCRVTQGAVHWAAFPEPTHEGVFHLHALLGGTTRLSVEQMERRWHYRNSIHVKIEQYLEPGGFQHYATKGISTSYSEVALSKSLRSRVGHAGVLVIP